MSTVEMSKRAYDELLSAIDDAMPWIDEDDPARRRLILAVDDAKFDVAKSQGGGSK